MPASYFGTAAFLTMVPRPQGPTQKIALESRPGVNGNAAWATGIRSEPQQIETLRDVVDWSAALTLCAGYQAMVGSVVTVTYAGTLQAFAALILDVDPQPESIVKGLGGVAGASTALVRARWTIETR
jgi:hypothetical protein